MQKINIFPLIYVIIMSIVLCLTQYYVPPFLPSLNNYKYIKIIISILLFLYIVQLSAIVHELAHALTSKNGKVNIPKLYYIPFIGYIEANNVNTSYEISKNTPNNEFIVSIAGFFTQFCYLFIMGIIFFKANPLALAIILFGFIVYLFVYMVLMKNNPSNDFANIYIKK